MSTAPPPAATILPDDPDRDNVPVILPHTRARSHPDAIPVVMPLEHDQEMPVAELAEPGPDMYALPVDDPEQRPGLVGRVRSAAGWCFGAASLMLGLAVLAAVPIGQFIVLGYLLEVSGRVARTGRLREGLIGVRQASRFGGAALAGFLLWCPLWFLAIQAEAAGIIAPGGEAARQMNTWLVVLTVLYALHVGGALLRGGRIRHFLNPLNAPYLLVRFARGGAYTEARDRLWNLVTAMRLPYYFWLGVRGFAGAFLWLVIPLLLLSQGHRAPLAGVVGGVLLAFVVLYVPFLQVRFARDNRFRAFREWQQVRSVYRRAPLAFAFALMIHLTFAVPLYLMKIEVIPRELMWLEGLVFLMFIFPARVLGGWAFARGARRAAPRFWLWRWAGRLAVLPAVAVYVLFVFFSQHIGWHGVPSLFEQHAFLLPVPFVLWK